MSENDVVKEIAPDEFKEWVIEADVPVVVDFSAEWCQPCKRLHPIIETVAGEYGDRVRFGTFDIDEDRKIPAQFDIMSVPTIIFFKDGEQFEELHGVQPEEVIRKHVDDMLAG